MGYSNNRTKEYDTIHHLVSRIAHRVYFLKDEERNDFVRMMRHAAEFCGIKLIGWCIMTNHFHILAYLPQRINIDEDEVLRRVSILKGEAAGKATKNQFEEWRRSGDSGEARVEEEIRRITARMYSIAWFMKILKQWFTIEYNRRHSHKGTLWESAYFDRNIKHAQSKIAKCLGYIHLNPIRAAAAVQYDEYSWSSYAAFRRGDKMAIDGMKFVYGNDVPIEEIRERHDFLLDSLLETEKRRRAEDILRKRDAGYELPPDQLTDEAMIAQTKAHLDKVRSEFVAIHEATGRTKKRKEYLAAIDGQIAALREKNPAIKPREIANIIGVSERTVYRALVRMCQKKV